MPPVNFTSGNVRISGQQEVQDEEGVGTTRSRSSGFCGRRRANGRSVAEVCRKQGISEQTFYRWRRSSGK
ncbi:transposase [bacterium]|nr:transposase [bacterium]